MVYTQEPIDINDLQTLFEDNWEVKSGTEIPVPRFFTNEELRVDPSQAEPAAVNIQLQAINEKWDGYAAQHVSIRAAVLLDIWTRRPTASAGGTDRQYLHDVKQELRRIIFANKHSLTNWQVMVYQRFEDDYEARYHGQMYLELQNDGIAVPAELVDDDLFNRSNGALGGEWTFTDTWEVVSNQAALQSVSSRSVARFTPSTTFKANHRVQVDIVTAAGMEVGLVFRYQDSNNYWFAEMRDVSGSKNLRLRKNVGGVVATRAKISDIGWVDGDRLELAVNLLNNCISVQLNGATRATVFDSAFQTEKVYGLYSSLDQTSRFDNLMIFEAGGSSR